MSCAWESELLDALQRGYVGADLKAHVSECESCSELRAVAGALLDDRVSAVAEAHVPDSGAMLWRLQVRHRRDVEAAARRSLLIGQAATVAIAIVLVASLFGVEIANITTHLAASIHVSTAMIVAVVASLFVIPLAGFVAIRQK